jgi:hypothetical protein
MIIVAPPRADLGEPATVVANRAAQLLLDRRVDEDSIDLRNVRSGEDWNQMSMSSPV